MRFVRPLTCRMPVRTRTRALPFYLTTCFFFFLRFHFSFFSDTRVHTCIRVCTRARSRARMFFSASPSPTLPLPAAPVLIFSSAQKPPADTAAPLRQRDIKTTERNAGCAKC